MNQKTIDILLFFAVWVLIRSFPLYWHLRAPVWVSVSHSCVHRCDFFFLGNLTIATEVIGLQNHSWIGVQDLDRASVVKKQKDI